VKIVLLTLLFIVLPWGAFAAAKKDFVDKATLPSDRPVETEVSLQQRDTSTGVFLPSYNTAEDQARFSILYHWNYNPREFTNFAGLEFIFAKKYPLFWVDFFFSQNRAMFKTIGEMNTQISSDSRALRETNEALTSLGMGISYRFNWIQELLSPLIETRRVFETTAAFLTYNYLSEKYTSNSFSGPGLKTDFGLHYRMSKSYHCGLKMSYNLATVKKQAGSDSGSSSERSLTLSWLTFAFDLSYYF
jgi:hypothetical protein